MPPLLDRLFLYPSLPQLEVAQRNQAKKYESFCRVRLYRHRDRDVLVTTEREDNTGTTAREAAPWLAAMVCSTHGLDPGTLVVISHAPAEDPAMLWLVLEPLPGGGLRVAQARPLPTFACRELLGEVLED